MKEGEFDIVVVICWIVIAAGVIGLSCCWTQGVCDGIWRDQLTKSGHAEYFIDAANQRKWRMKEAK